MVRVTFTRKTLEGLNDAMECDVAHANFKLRDLFHSAVPTENRVDEDTLERGFIVRATEGDSGAFVLDHCIRGLTTFFELCQEPEAAVQGAITEVEKKRAKDVLTAAAKIAALNTPPVTVSLRTETDILYEHEIQLQACRIKSALQALADKKDPLPVDMSDVVIDRIDQHGLAFTADAVYAVASVELLQVAEDLKGKLTDVVIDATEVTVKIKVRTIMSIAASMEQEEFSLLAA